MASNGISRIRTVGTFIAGRACPDTLFHVLCRAFDQPMAAEERAAMPLAGGILQHGFQCGMLWGATLAAGARAHRVFGSGSKAETVAIAAAERLVERFRAANDAVNCVDITDIDRSSSKMEMVTYFLLKGGTIGCFRMAADYAPMALDEIDAALTQARDDAPTSPVSCAAMLARRMGASDLHAVMATGFAGGIGLSGGACGALGAAIWIAGLTMLAAGAAKIGYDEPRLHHVIRRFLACTGNEFECLRITGRKFDAVGDHADFLRDGGCAEVIEALAVA
jgi:hypothetical protein